MSSPSSSYRLEGQVICLTGASSGIGAAIAKSLYLEGAKVMIGARRLEKLEEVVADCKSIATPPPGDITPFVCDVTDRSSVQTFHDAAVAKYCDTSRDGNDSVDVMICCAGVMYFTQMKNALMDQWDQTLDVNCRGVMNCIGVSLPKMVATNEQRAATPGTPKLPKKIVSITSDAGVRDFPNLAVYCASKTFVETMTEITRRELVGTGVTLHTVQPGDVKGTELIMKNSDTEAAAKMGVEIGKPVGEGFDRNQLLDPQDVADAVLMILTAPPHVAINSILVESRDQE